MTHGNKIHIGLMLAMEDARASNPCLIPHSLTRWKNSSSTILETCWIN